MNFSTDIPSPLSVPRDLSEDLRGRVYRGIERRHELIAAADKLESDRTAAAETVNVSDAKGLDALRKRFRQTEAEILQGWRDWLAEQTTLAGEIKAESAALRRQRDAEEIEIEKKLTADLLGLGWTPELVKSGVTAAGSPLRQARARAWVEVIGSAFGNGRDAAKVEAFSKEVDRKIRSIVASALA